MSRLEDNKQWLHAIPPLREMKWSVLPAGKVRETHPCQCAASPAPSQEGNENSTEKSAVALHNARPGAARGVAGIVVDRPFVTLGLCQSNSLRGNERYRSDKLDKRAVIGRALSPRKDFSLSFETTGWGLFVFCFILSLFSGLPTFAQQTYIVDISKTQAPIITGHLKLGTHTNAAGHTLDANSLYFIKDGKPWYPVMGEFHFSRYPKARWEESILRMKANGINVIATYVFWIYHEEEEGKFYWTGNRDLRYFIALCKKHNISVLTRIGPWCHGEVRNGGFPDWIVKRGNMRKNNPEYLASVQTFYDAIAGQLNGLYFKDGGPIIGTQIENEFRFNNPTGLEHMLTLKKMAIKAGMDVPFYTATGWPGSNLKQDELVPVWGAYPEAPWDKKTTQLALSENYIFSTLRNDPAIGSDLLGKHEEDASSYTGYRYPYATAEMGGGIQITYHRRPIIEPVDVATLAYVKVGAGANLMGYYMFHGGHNEVGKLSTLQESKATNYPNDYPILNYDFQAPLGEFGQVRPSYRSFKVMHTFLNNFGDRLVQYYPSFPDLKAAKPNDSTTLRFSVRSKGNSGFVFISNYQRHLKLKDQQGVQFNLKLADGKSISFPEKGIDIKDGVKAILPFNMAIEGANLRYATVQPLCKLPGTVPTYVFFAPEGIRPEYMFDKTGITKIDASQVDLQTRTDSYLINKIQPGTSGLITLTFNNGKKVNILTLTNQQALDSWTGNALGGEHLFISKQNLTFAGGKVKMQSSGDTDFSLLIYPAVKAKAAFKASANGVFTNLSKTLTVKTVKISSKEVSNVSLYDKKEGSLPLDDRNAKNTTVSPGPQYQTNMTTVNGAKYWVLSVPALTQNALLDIDYRGDTGSAYINGKLVADDFYFGKTMQVYLQKSSTPKQIILQVVPLTDERQIYFEKGIREPMQGKSVADLKGVKIIPQYEEEL
ncbi:beta-galactosidase [Mucilaginibacter terrae]|uniref:Beta-galactosidase n=1 Tax=Mucilaginibacter terrae TaxID=1955052 RepID=A0ABU3GUC9_9SPHI|nr:beta-galactosidase [Mucilaginibacter terrae]MDT3403384.1 beta-galactosidase [Mucilaginibacter terrae]